MNPIAAGNLRRRITLQRRIPGQDAYGQGKEAWKDVAAVWADIEPVSGREIMLGQAVGAEVAHKIIIRYRGDVTPAMRAIYRGRAYHITSVIDVEARHIAMHLLCSEGLIDSAPQSYTDAEPDKDGAYTATGYTDAGYSVAAAPGDGNYVQDDYLTDKDVVVTQYQQPAYSVPGYTT